MRLRLRLRNIERDRDRDRKKGEKSERNTISGTEEEQQMMSKKCQKNAFFKNQYPYRL